jgi:hypothetical protein
VDYIAGLYEADPTASYFAQGNSTVAYNFDITGNLTNDNGILSNFANNVYASLPNAWISENYDTWEMVFDITTGSDVSSQQFIYSNFYNSSGVYSGVNYQIYSSNFRLSLRIGGSSTTQTGTYTVLANTRYLIRIKFTGSAYTLEYSTDNGLTWVIDINYASTTKVTTRSEGYFIIGGLYLQSHGAVETPFLGSINLNNSYIKVNNSVFWEGVTVTSFTPEQEWQASVTQYGVCGKFVYDSVNNTVRLPKVTGIIEGTTDASALGDLVEQFVRLPNITARWRSSQDYGQSGAAYRINSGQSGYGGSYYGSDTGFDASRISSVYSGNGTDTKIQPQAIKYYYYIVIATSTKTDIQVDIDEIATDLNEIATDLNGKADVDLGNINPTQNIKDMIVGWGMPDYTAGVVKSWGTVYTAERNGLIYVRGDGGSSEDSTLLINNVKVSILCSGFNGIVDSLAFVGEGDTYQARGGGAAYPNSRQIIFYPLKGAN